MRIEGNIAPRTGRSDSRERRETRERRERGAALVEFAFVLPILILLIVGIVNFGRAFGAKEALIHATREGARVYAVTQDNGEASAAFWSGATGLDSTRVTVFIPAGSCSPGEPISVRASYHFDFIAMPFGSINIGSEAVMRCGG